MIFWINRRHFLSLSLVLLTLIQFSAKAQTAIDSTKYCPEKSLPELFKRKDSVLVLKPVKNSFFLIMPIIGSQPATGFSYGFVTQYTFK